jgi:hypothetical protein
MLYFFSIRFPLSGTEIMGGCTPRGVGNSEEASRCHFKTSYRCCRSLIDNIRCRAPRRVCVCVCVRAGVSDQWSVCGLCVYTDNSSHCSICVRDVIQAPRQSSLLYQVKDNPSPSTPLLGRPGSVGAQAKEISRRRDTSLANYTVRI